MATIVKAGEYDPTNLAAVAWHFGQKGEDAPVLTLLEQGADPNSVRGSGSLTALDGAVIYDRVTVVRALLHAGAYPDPTGKSGLTPLMQAKSADVARLLLEAGANVDAIVYPNRIGIPVGGTALMFTARLGRTEIAELLLAYKVDINRRDENGFSALMVAAQAEQADIIRLLCEAGAEIGLLEAALLGDYHQVQVFLKAGADLNIEEMANALRWASQAGHLSTVALLLHHGAPIEAGDVHKCTALQYAARSGRIETMRLLLERGADPNATSMDGVTALMATVEAGKESKQEAVELLLEHGAHVNVQTRRGWTALIGACLFGHTEVVDLLLQHGADPNHFTDAEVMAREEGCSNSNALMMAVANGHIDVVKLLLQYGADPLAKSNADRSALDTATRTHGFKQAERQEILPLLKAAVAHL